ncbi:hypothetical protein ACFFVB_10965 [Formosa undariae]|uniref:Uncharacterized protein n=1 Tax=Formosa undariae TaxID=1325436 RepID=A0ABV5F2C5_9FLAO
MYEKKTYHVKLFNPFRLSGRVPEDHFQRRSQIAIDLNFIYKTTRLDILYVLGY